MAQQIQRNWLFKILFVALVIIAFIGQAEAKRTNPKTKPTTGTKTTTTKTVTRRVVKKPTVVVRPSQPRVVVPSQPRVIVPPVQPRVVVVPPVQPRVVVVPPVQPHTVVVPPVQPVVIPPVQPVVVRQSMPNTWVHQQPPPLTISARPQSCMTKPTAIVNKYTMSTQFKCRFNCATNMQEGQCIYVPRTCIVNGVQSQGVVTEYNSQQQSQYSFNCATNQGPTFLRYYPATCMQKPTAIVNSYKVREERKYSYNCATHQQLSVQYWPQSCSQGRMSSYRSVRDQFGKTQYMKFDCRTQQETIVPPGSIGLIIGVVIGLCVCICILGAIFGNKGGDGDHEEEVEIIEEVVYEQPDTIVYQQPDTVYVQEQPQVIYDQQPGYVQPGYVQPGMVVQSHGGYDPYTGQEVVNEVEY